MGFCSAKKILRRFQRTICLGVLLARRGVNPPPPLHTHHPLLLAQGWHNKLATCQWSASLVCFPGDQCPPCTVARRLEVLANKTRLSDGGTNESLTVVLLCTVTGYCSSAENQGMG